MKKIVFVTEQVVDDVKGKYYSTELYTFLKRYRQLGYVHAYCYSKKTLSSNASKLEFEGDNNITFLEKPNTLYKRFCANEHLSQLQEDIKTCDMVISHLPSLYFGNKAIKTAQQYNKKYVIACVGCPWDSLFNYNWKGKILAPFEFLRMRRLIKNAPYVFYVTKSFLQNRYPTEGLSINCSNVDINTGDVSLLEAKLLHFNKNVPEFRIMTSAAIDVRYKGQQYVIAAIAPLIKSGHNIHYYLAGGGSRTYLESVAKHFNISENVHFLGKLSKEQVLENLDKTDLYIQPSKQEGLPRALIEAMSRACPALGSKIAGIPELLDASCIFKAGDVTELRSKIELFTKDKLIIEAKRNFEVAKEYDCKILNERRLLFLRKALES